MQLSCNAQKPRLVIVISSDIYIRNYVTTNAFSELIKNYDCFYLVSDLVKNLSHFSAEDEILHYKYESVARQKHQIIFNLIMRRYKNKSKSFGFRIKRIDHLDLKNFTQSNKFLFALKMVRRIILWLNNKFKSKLLSSEFVFPYYFKFLTKNLFINQNLLAHIKKINPSLVVFPSSAYEPEAVDLVKISNDLNKPSLFLIDNWDNLSSKSIMTLLPSYVGVWGQQSLRHACEIQGFSHDQVACIGTPRFDKYFKLRDLKLKNIFDFKYILFVGTTLEFNEAAALKKINEIVSDNQNIFNEIKIIYRPHPWRQGRDSIVGMNLEHVIIDPQLINQYSQKIHTTDFQPSLDYYPSLIQNAEIVIGGLSSMLIETLIFKKCFVAIVYKESGNLTNPHNVLNNYEHFEGLDKIDAIEFCHEVDDFEQSILSLWKRKELVDFEMVDNQRRYYCYNDSRDYPQRLNALCISITQLTPNSQ